MIGRCGDPAWGHLRTPPASLGWALDKLAKTTDLRFQFVLLLLGEQPNLLVEDRLGRQTVRDLDDVTQPQTRLIIVG